MEIKISLPKKLALILSFILMIAVNSLASTTMFNNISTGQVSDLYGNLFAPAGITFSIWGVIYLLLLIALLYYVFIFKSYDTAFEREELNKIVFVFILTNIINALWLVAWRYLQIELSVAIMVIFLCLLANLNYSLKSTSPQNLEYVSSKLVFGIYFGWITIATIANITSMLVKLKWDKFGLSEVFWMVIVLFAAIIIVSINGIKLRCIPYFLVAIWAFIGIIIKHVTVFNSDYPQIIVVSIVGIFLFIIDTILVIILNKKHKSFQL